MAKMTKLNSAIRKSLRLHPLSVQQLLRQVMSEEGVELPDGTRVPKGCWLGVVTAPGVHMDERYYKDPDVFDPFRFSRSRVETSGEGVTALDSQSDHRTELATTTSESFLTWGYGKNAWYAFSRAPFI